MSEGPWFKFYPSDWLAGTRGMTAAEMGVYITIIAMIYDAGGPVRDDEKRLARRCGISVATFRKIRDALVDEGKIDVTESGISNARAISEIENREKISQSNRGSANERWKVEKGKKVEKTIPEECDRIENAMPHARASEARSQMSDIAATESSNEDSAQQPRAAFRDELLDWIEDRLTSRFGRPIRLSQRGRVAEWREAGWPDAILRRVIGAKIDDLKSPPTSLRYFDAALADEQRRDVPQAGAPPPPIDPKYLAALEEGLRVTAELQAQGKLPHGKPKLVVQ